jgi:hypothetical protein
METYFELSDIEQLYSSVVELSLSDEFKLGKKPDDICMILHSQKTGNKSENERIAFSEQNLIKSFLLCLKEYGAEYQQNGDQITALFSGLNISKNETQALYCSMELLKLNELYNNYSSSLLDNQSDKYLSRNLNIVLFAKSHENNHTGQTKKWDDYFQHLALCNSIAVSSEIESKINEQFTTEKLKLPEISNQLFENLFLIKGKKKNFCFITSKTKFVGRENELKKISDLFTSHFSNKYSIRSLPLVVNINGKAGIGKTRFLNELLNHKLSDSFNNNDVEYLYGKASFTEKMPYFIFKELIKSALCLPPKLSNEVINRNLIYFYNKAYCCLDENEITSLKESIPILKHILGLRIKDPRLEISGKDLQMVFEYAIKCFISTAIKMHHKNKTAVVIILEDLHWCDESSLECLEFLFKTISADSKNQNSPFTFLLINREYRLPVYDKISKYSQFENVELSPLTNENIGEMLNSALKDYVVEENVKTDLFEKSCGNPFYIEEWMRYVNQSKCLNADTKGLAKVPDDLQSMIIWRVNSLNESGKKIIQVASIAGIKFEWRFLFKAVSKYGLEKALDEELKNLIKNEFIHKIPGKDIYEFNHDLICKHIYESLINQWKTTLHKNIAEIIESSIDNGDLANYYCDLAKHFDLAQMSKRAIPYLGAAGKQSFDRYANTEAIHYYKRLIFNIDRDEQLSNEITNHSELKTNAFSGLVDFSQLPKNLTALDLSDNYFKGSADLSKLPSNLNEA